jgi:hypothetical protein
VLKSAPSKTTASPKKNSTASNSAAAKTNGPKIAKPVQKPSVGFNSSASTGVAARNGFSHFFSEFLF